MEDTTIGLVFHAKGKVRIDGGVGLRKYERRRRHGDQFSKENRSISNEELHHVDETTDHKVKGLSNAEDWGKDADGRADQQLLPRAQKKNNL